MLDYKLYNHDCRQMPELEDNSVHAVVTSPPYWGLRKYAGEQELIWGDNHCEHQWYDTSLPKSGGVGDYEAGRVGNAKARSDSHDKKESSTCQLCGAWKGAYGLEPTPEMYIEHSVLILQEVRRVLRPDGVVWWNIGDSYYGGGNNAGNTHPLEGKQATNKGANNLQDVKSIRGKHNIVKPLDLCLIPQRLAIALQIDGWWVRSIIIWDKSNPMPESVNGWRWERHRVKVRKSARAKAGTAHYLANEGKPLGARDGHEFLNHDSEYQDCPGCPKCSPNDGLVLRKGSWRPTDAHEYILMLAKSDNYYCDMEAVREAYTEPMNRWGGPELKRDTSKTAEYKENQQIGYSSAFRVGRPMRPNENGRNLRSVWSFPTTPYPGAHFAVFPPKLPETCIKAATPEYGVCAKCGAPWARVIEKELADHNGKTESMSDSGDNAGRIALLRQAARERGGEYVNESKTVGWRATCNCGTDERVPATVLDPFAGAGTTLLTALRLGRCARGYDTSNQYCGMIRERLAAVQPQLISTKGE